MLAPAVWNMVQYVLGAPEFKRALYSSVLAPSGRLLDFGCATGHLADAFLGYEYYGLDVNAAAVKSAARAYGAHPNMHFVCADLRSRPFPDNHFDEVLFAATVHHLDDRELSGILPELHRCLRPGGTIHIIDPVFQPSDGWQAKLLRRLDRGRFPRTAAQIESLVAAAGLFSVGIPTLHRPYGALLQDCDFLHLPVTKAPQ